MEEGKTDTRLLLAIVACVLVVAALGLSTCGSSADTTSPEAAVQSYFGAIADGDAEDACSVGTEGFREEATASVIGTPSEGETCEEAIANVPDEARELIDEVEVVTIDSGGGQATVEATIEAEDFPHQPVRFNVVREDDEWHIAGLA